MGPRYSVFSSQSPEQLEMIRSVFEKDRSGSTLEKELVGRGLFQRLEILSPNMRQAGSEQWRLESKTRI